MVMVVVAAIFVPFRVTATTTTRVTVPVAGFAGSRTGATSATASTHDLSAGSAQQPPQGSVLGTETPLPLGVENKFVNILRLKELLADHPDQIWSPAL